MFAILHSENSQFFLEKKHLQVDLFVKKSRILCQEKGNIPEILTVFFIKNSRNFRQEIPRAQKAWRLNDIFVPQIVGFRRKGGREIFVEFFDFAFYVINNNMYNVK